MCCLPSLGPNFTHKSKPEASLGLAQAYDTVGTWGQNVSLGFKAASFKSAHSIPALTETPPAVGTVLYKAGPFSSLWGWGVGGEVE